MGQQAILVTGGSGFLGRRLVKVLEHSGDWQVLAPPSAELDLLNPEQTERYLAESRVKNIIHAAGFVGGIGLNRAYPGRMIRDNLRMGLNLLDAAANCGDVQVGIISTVCVYPETAPVPTPETAMFDGYPAQDTAAYGIAKRTLWTVAESLRQEKGLRYRYIIPTNLYGPGDHFDDAKSHVAAALIRRAVEATRKSLKEIIVWGDGTSTRDLLYVDDAVEGIIRAQRHPGAALTVNLSSGSETSIRSLAESVCELVGFSGHLVWDASKPMGAPRRRLDGTRAERELGFEARTSLREGLQDTIKWYETTFIG